MLRFNVLLVLFLGVLVSCSPAEPPEAAALRSQEQSATPVPLTRSTSASPTSINFGNRKVGTSVTQTVRLTNTSNDGETVTINNVAISNQPNPAHFTVSPTSATIPVGGHEDFTVTFTPRSTGQKTATLTIASPSTSASVSLSGFGKASAADVSPASHAFGDGVVNGPSASTTVAVSNIGNATFRITPSLMGAGAAAYFFTPSFLDVAAGGTESFTVTFDPQAGGAADATLTFTTNESGSPAVQSVTLTGNGLNPTLSVPTAVAFGEHSVGAPGATRLLTVSNTGIAGNLVISNIVKAGAGEAAYSFTPATLDVPPGESRTLSVTFAPGTESAADAILTLTTNDVANETEDIDLSGTGISPAISAAGSLAFGEQRIGATAATQTLTVTNTGTSGTLKITDIVKGGSGQAAYSFTPATLEVPFGESRPLTVTFTPSATGAANATLTLATNAVGSETFTVALSGTGINPTLAMPSSLAFGEQAVGVPAATRTLTVQNTGTEGNLVISNIVKAGAGEAAYTFSPATLDVPPGGSLPLTVTFAPSGSGAANATLTLTTNALGNETFTVTLSGTGIQPTISVPGSMTFSEHRVGAPGATQTLTVQNSGTGTLRITNIAKSGPEAAAYSFSPATLDVPTGESRPLTVTFAPIGPGETDATLTLTTNDVARQSVLVTLSGTGINPTLSMPNTLAFGEQPVGAPTATQTLTVQNTGTGTLRITNIVKGGSGQAAYSFTPATLDVPTGESRTLTVTFSPSAAGAANATLTLTTNDVARETFTVTLSGTGTRPAITVPNTLAFGEHSVGAPAATQTLTVQNSGTSGTLRITSIAMGGQDPSAFTFSPATLDVPFGESRPLTVTFAPAAQVAASASLTLTTNEVNRTTVTVTLSGTGVSPAIMVPGSRDFGEQRVGAPGTTQALTVQNTGTSGTLKITHISQAGAGAAAYSFMPTTLDVPFGQTRSLTVTFAPVSVGSAPATLTLTTNDVARPTVTVTLSGTGIDPTISVPATLAFGEQSVGAVGTTQTLTVQNSGTGTLSITNIVKGGSGNAAYSFTPATLDVPAGQSRPLSVTFTPTVEGPADATLTLTTNDVARPTVTVTLSGTGIRPIISVPGSLAFGEHRVGAPAATQTLTVQNTGATGNLRITNIAKSGPGQAAYSFTPATLDVPPGQSRPLTVMFAPTGEGLAEASLTLTTNDVDRPTVTVILTGTGVVPAILVPGSLAFGEHRVGAPAATQTLTVQNTGTSGTLSVTQIAKSGPEQAAYSFTPATVDVPAGQSRDVTVTFAPLSEGAANATLTLTTNDVDRPTVTVSLSGTGIRPTLSVPNTLAFGEHPVGAPAVTQTLMVQNTGTGTLSITNIAKGGPGNAAYSFTPATLDVPAGQSRPLSVSFAPITQTAANATLTLTTNEVNRTTVTVTLSGTGINPAITVPAALPFGDHRVGVPGATQTLTVQNTGTSGTLRVTNIATGGTGAAAYSFTPTTLDVPNGQSRPVTVTFTPTVEGPADATLTLTTNDVNRSSVTVDLSGTGIDPTISVPATLAFGEQSVGAVGTTQALTVQNTGTGMLRITSITRSGPQQAAFNFTPSTLDVPEGQTGTVTVTFAASAEGAASASLTLTTNDVARPTVTVGLAGTGIRPTISVATSLPFGEHRVGVPGTMQTLTVSNSGTGTLSITNITKSGPGSAAYSFTPSTLDVPEGQTGTLTVTFSPAVEGLAEATLTLTTNDVDRSSVTVTLTGTGIRPVVSVAPSSLDFGDVQVDENSTRMLVVSNIGSGTLNISNIAKDPGAVFYTFTPPTLNVPAGQSRTLTVTFRPTVEGQSDAFLTLTTNEVGRPTVRVDLSGYGGRATALLSPTSLAFDGVRVGATRLRTVRLTNTGRAPLVISTAPTISSTFFTYQGPSSATINAGSFIDFQVAFAPTANISYGGTLTITSNATNSPTPLSLTGFGANPELNLNPTSIFFGDVRVGTDSAKVPVTVSNTGNAELIVQSLPVQGPFAVSLRTGDVLPKTVVAGSPFTFDVVFRPSAEGSGSGSVSILTDLNTTPTPKVTLSGTGTVARIELSPTALDFGDQRVEHVSGVQPVIVTNRGAAELQISQIIFSNPVFTITAPDLPTDGNPLRIGAGEQRALSVVFTPSTLGPTAGKLFIISNAFESVDPMDLTGSGVDGQMSVTPSSVAFGSADVGGTGVQQSVTLKNIGRYPLTIEEVNPPLDTAFTVSGLPNGLVLQPNDTWPFTVTFTPMQRGYISSSAVIESDAVTNTLLNLAMAGTGVAAAVELQPQDINFGKSNVAVSVTQDIAIKNVGEKDLSVSNIAFEDAVGGPVGGALDFSLDTGVALPLVVQPGKSTLVRLKFTPRVVGQREARAIVYTNDRAAEANLVGVGTSPRLALSVDGQSVSKLEFGNVLVGNPSASTVLRITNTGDGPLTLSSMTVGGADVAAFIMTPPTLPLTLQAASFAEVSVSVRPDAERPFSGQLTVLSNDGSTPNVTVPMTAVGVRQQIQLSKLSLDFGRQLINNLSSPRTVTVTNSSASRVTLSALSLEGTGASQFTLAAQPLPKTLEPGAEVELAATFTPLAEAEVEGKLKITFSEPPLQLEVALHGQGISSVLSVRPSPLDFGTVRTGSSKREQPLTIANLSSEPITLSEPDVVGTGVPFLFDKAALQGLTIAPGSSIIVTVGYQPSVETLSEFTVSMGTTSPPRPRSLDFQMKGRATNRLLTVDPISLDFGRVDVSDPIEPRVITVENKSAQQQRVVVKLKNVEGTAYTMDARGLGDPIPAAGSATFTIAFQPQKAGSEENEVQVWLQGEAEAEAIIPVIGHGRQLSGQGGGCSSSTLELGSSGMLALLALVALGARRRRRE